MYSKIATMSVQSLLFALISFLSIGFSFAKNDLARGFNDDVDWLSLEEGKKIAKEQNKPIFLLIHKSWCGACKALKPKFATSKEIEELSKNFVMVNVQDDEEPQGFEYTPDGGYIPRILFLDSEGEVQKQFHNEGGSPTYKYYYPAVEDIVRSMKKVAKVQDKVEL